MIRLLLVFLMIHVSGVVHAQVTCVASSGSCSVADTSKSSGCRINAGSRCTISVNGVCKAVVQSMVAEDRLVSANIAATNNTDWETFMGTLNGFTASPCACDFNGTPVPDGSSVTAYQTSSVPYGSTCAQQQRTCSGGVLSGSYTFSSCTVDPGSNCSAIDGIALNHGQSRTFYLRACEDFGNTCSGQTRTCTNGTVSGTYANANCSVVTGSSCTLDGQTVASGSGRYFYNTTSVPFGQNCDTATYRLYRNCTNGVFDGSSSFNRASCSTAAAASCTKDGITRSHGQTYTFYQAASALTCSGESQTCNNGSWSPNTNQFASCSLACAAGAVSWSTNCSGNRVQTAHGSNNVVSNTASGYNGSATYACSNGVWQTPTSVSCTSAGGVWVEFATESCWDFYMSNCTPSNNCGYTNPAGQPCSPTSSTCTKASTTWFTQYNCQ